MLHCVIMAGGSGTRFWPQSRQRTPKQLLKLAGTDTMIQQTLDRCRSLGEPDSFWIVTSHAQADETRRQLPAVPADHVLTEPAARNTAPCVGLAAIHIRHADPDGVMLIMPADHLIAPVQAFHDAVQRAAALIEQDRSRLVLFGVPPAFPATGYGYIERGPALSDQNAFQVRSFREKPPHDVAEQYVASGHFYWNCGIFCWSATAILNELKQHEPDMADRLERLAAVIGTEQYNDVLADEFPQMNRIPIDRAVLERSQQACVIEAPFSWDDVGSWLAVPRLAGQDDHGNTLQGLVRTIDTSGCIVRSTDDHLIAVLGMEDCIIVHTDDATLVAQRDQSERIGEILSLLKEQGDTRFL